ncbi:hypothetical protein CC2G_014584 [Coprinopsis cinerea AmutBmut pab1-1]|nr:hypothetical protein CC2G_014584 [Coprinopsis cinerea AmutBmut pab1-1]
MHQDHFSDDGERDLPSTSQYHCPRPATETTPSSPTPASVYTPLPVSNLPSSGATTLVEDEQELLTETTNWLAVSLEEEVNRVFGLYYGFVSPLPSNTITAEDGPKIRKEFTRLLGLSNDMNPPEEYFSSNHYRSVLRFIAAHSRRQSPHPGSWDLRDDVVHPLKHSPRFRHLRIVDIPHSTDIEVVDKGLSDCVPRYYFFDFPSSRNPWKLALLNALDALFVCRLPPDFDDNDVVVALTQRGISFRLFFPRRLIRYPSYRTPSYCPLPVRPLNHKFTKADYDSYINTRTLVLAQPHMQAAIRRGGVIWRLAITTLGLADVQNVVGCGGVLSTRIPDYDGEYVEDGLTARELDLICGVTNMYAYYTVLLYLPHFHLMFFISTHRLTHIYCALMTAD